MFAGIVDWSSKVLDVRLLTLVLVTVLFVDQYSQCGLMHIRSDNTSTVLHTSMGCGAKLPQTATGLRVSWHARTRARAVESVGGLGCILMLFDRRCCTFLFLLACCEARRLPGGDAMGG